MHVLRRPVEPAGQNGRSLRLRNTGNIHEHPAMSNPDFWIVETSVVPKVDTANITPIGRRQNTAIKNYLDRPL